MKKILLVMLALGGLTFSCFAQKTDAGKFSIGIDAGLPLGTAGDVSSLIIGGSFKYDMPIAKKMFFTVSAGYSYIPYKNDILINNTAYITTNSGEGYVPLKAGLKYFFCNNFYGEGQVGTAISTQSGGGAAFAYAPGVGLKLGDADIGVRYEGWSKNGNTISQIALHLAYSF
jgi:hypothetical protein